MHHPPCLVSLCLIIALRLGCPPSHPGIRRRDPPSAPPSTAFSWFLPCWTLSLLFFLLNCSRLTPADFSCLLVTLDHPASLVTALGFQDPVSSQCFPFSSSLPQPWPSPLSGPQQVPPSLGRQSCDKWNEDSISTLTCPQGGLLMFTL